MKKVFNLAEVFSSNCAGFQKAAFTLAEVLITLGIIGIVAALTLPTLIQNHKKQTLVNQLKKVVNTLENAAQMAVAEEGVSSFEDTKAYSIFMDYYSCSGSCADFDITKLVNFLNIKYVSIDKSNKDYSSNYKSLNGSSISRIFTTDPVTMLDGSIVYFNGGGGGILVDVNGNKGPNQEGRDAFHLRYNNKGLLTDETYGCDNTTEDSYLNSKCYYTKIVSDGWKMNY